uniref:Uncharacterized protein n=1 Tax=Arundo donax TaxID=35708 RepID=A0A0A9C0V1_ARUDO
MCKSSVKEGFQDKKRRVVFVSLSVSNQLPIHICDDNVYHLAADYVLVGSTKKL